MHNTNSQAAYRIAERHIAELISAPVPPVWRRGLRRTKGTRLPTQTLRSAARRRRLALPSTTASPDLPGGADHGLDDLHIGISANCAPTPTTVAGALAQVLSQASSLTFTQQQARSAQLEELVDLIAEPMIEAGIDVKALCTGAETPGVLSLRILHRFSTLASGQHIELRPSVATAVAKTISGLG